jgi:hypothetical protein
MAAFDINVEPYMYEPRARARIPPPIAPADQQPDSDSDEHEEGVVVDRTTNTVWFV